MHKGTVQNAKIELPAFAFFTFCEKREKT